MNRAYENNNEEDGDGRRRAHAFKAERQAHFSRNVRAGYLDEGRKKKDEERARMEAYRVLCEREGVKSERLAEYDRTRQAASQNLGQALEEIDYDENLTNNEKKKRKFNAKRKFAATTVTELVEKHSKKYNAVTKVERLQQDRQKDRDAMRKEREERNRAKRQRVDARRSKNALYNHKTKRGQPLMASRMEALLKDITTQRK